MADEEEAVLFEAPSYQKWLNEQNEKLDADKFPPVAVRRAWHIAGETPAKFFSAIAFRAAYGGTRNWLRRQNRKAVPSNEDDAPKQYLKPEQMELPDLLGFLIANFDRRLADIESERRFVEDWCAVPGRSMYTPTAIYRQAGVVMPKVPKNRAAQVAA